MSRSFTGENTVNNIDDACKKENSEITEEEKRRIIREKHIELVHRGSKVVFEELKAIYTWCKSESLVKEELEHCMECKKYNPKRRRRPVLVKSYYPGEKIAIDIIGPIKSKYIITGIDYFTRKG